MAELVNGMNSMSVQDSRFAPRGGPGGPGGPGKPAYIPPHLRGKMAQAQAQQPAPQAPINNGPAQGNTWQKYVTLHHFPHCLFSFLSPYFRRVGGVFVTRSHITD